MTRKRIIAIAIAVLTVLAISTVALLGKKSPEPLAVTGTQQSQPTTPETPDEEAPEDPAELGHDHGGEEFPATELAQMKRNGESAVSAYTTQVADESKTNRRNRLDSLFIDGSAFPEKKAPVSEVYSVSSTILESEFTKASKPTNVALRVYIKANINTGFDAYKENQTWLVELTKQQNVWLTTSIKPSSLPYIEAQS